MEYGEGGEEQSSSDSAVHGPEGENSNETFSQAKKPEQQEERINGMRVIKAPLEDLRQ